MYYVDRFGREFETKEELTAFYEQADQIGSWEKAHRVPERQRLTWFYPDFGVYVPNYWVQPKEIAQKYSKITRQITEKNKAFTLDRER